MPESAWGAQGLTPEVAPTFKQRTIVAWFLRDTKTGQRERVRIANRHNGLPERTCRHISRRPARCDVCVIEAMQLSCGHRQKADIERPAGSIRKTAPCDECGYSPRRAVQAFLAARAEATFTTDLRMALRRATENPTRLDSLAEFVVVVLDVMQCPPRTVEEEQRTERIHRAASVAGLLDVRAHAR